MKSIILFAIICMLVTFIYCEDDPCIVKFQSGREVNLHELTQEKYFTAAGDYGMTFYVNICAKAKYTCGSSEYPSSVDTGFECKAASSNNPGTIIATPTNEIGDVPSLTLKYTGGEKDGSNTPLATTIEITCTDKPDAPDTFAYKSDTNNNGVREFLFTLSSPKACFQENSGDFFTIVIGVGGIIIMVAIAGIILFLVVGIIVQIVRVKKFNVTLDSKMDYIPFWSFFSLLPFLFKDGILLVVDGIKAIVAKFSKGKASESYESV